MIILLDYIFNMCLHSRLCVTVIVAHMQRVTLFIKMFFNF